MQSLSVVLCFSVVMFSVLFCSVLFCSWQYVFLTMEAMIDTAVHIGIPREMAKIMVGNTVKVSQAVIRIISVLHQAQAPPRPRNCTDYLSSSRTPNILH